MVFEFNRAVCIYVKLCLYRCIAGKKETQEGTFGLQTCCLLPQYALDTPAGRDGQCRDAAMGGVSLYLNSAFQVLSVFLSPLSLFLSPSLFRCLTVFFFHEGC